MKTTKQIKLDWNKLLAFRQHQSQRGANTTESLNRLKSTMVGVKVGGKPVGAR